MTTLDLGHTTVDLVVTRGGDYTVTLDYTDADTIVGYTWTVAIMAAADGTAVAAGTVVANTSTKLVTCTWTDTQTAALTSPQYVWKVVETNAAGTVTPIVGGRCTVRAQGARGRAAETSTTITVQSGTVTVGVSGTPAIVASVARALVNTGAIDARDYATSGSGTSSSPYVSADGTGGIGPAITAAVAAGKDVIVPAGHYAVTSTITIGASSLNIITDGSATVLHAGEALVDGLAVNCAGTSGTYLEGVTIGGFHLVRTSGGSVRIRYCRYMQVGVVTAEGAGGGVLSLRDVEDSRFDGVLGWELGVSGAAVFVNKAARCQFGALYAEGGQEALDLFETHHCTFEAVTSYNAGDEGVDMGCSTYNLFGPILVVDPATNGVSCKVEDGGVSGGSGWNQFTEVTVVGHTGIGFDIANSPATPNGTDVNNHNSVHALTVVSAAAGAKGARLAGGTTNPVPTGNTIRNLHIDVPGIGVDVSYQTDPTIEGGWVRSSGAAAVAVAGPSDSYLVIRPHLTRLTLTGGTSVNDAALTLSRCTDLDVTDLDITASGGNGIYATRCKRGRISRNRISECQHHGVYFVGRDEALWRGRLDVEFVGNYVRNIGKGAANRWAFNVTQTGSTATEGVYIDGNVVTDDQTVSTTSGVVFNGTFDYCTLIANKGRRLVNATSGSVGANGVSDNNLLSTS